MGFEKWFIKNGPGSIGESAKFFSKYYSRLNSANPGATWLDLFLTMYLDRVNTNARFDPKNKRGGSLSTISTDRLEKILNATQGDLPLFIALVTNMEDPKVQQTYFDYPDLLRLSLQVIHETVSSNCPGRTIFNKEELWRNFLTIKSEYYI